MAKYEMEQNFYTEMDKLKHENEIEMLTIRDELDKANDSIKLKERDYELKCDQFQTDLKMKQKQINKFNEELSELKSYNMDLLEQIEQKGIEIRQIKHDVQEEIRLAFLLNRKIILHSGTVKIFKLLSKIFFFIKKIDLNFFSIFTIL
jgi:hypothetical protein